MLYVVYGAETDRVRAKKDALVASCRKQRPDAEFFAIERDNFPENGLEELCSSQGLFVKKHIVVLDRLLPNKKSKSDDEGDEDSSTQPTTGKKETKDFIKEALIADLPNMAESESVFILFETAIDAKMFALVKKYAKDVFVFGEKKEKKEFNNISFDISDAYAAKDKRGAWINYQKALRLGIAPEAMYGAIFSGVKTMLLSKKTRSAEEAGAKSYPYNKAKNFARNYTEDELSEILTRLNKVYHGIRSEGGQLEIELEKILLGG